MDALSAPLIAPALPGGDAEATSPPDGEAPADFAALVAALLAPLPGLPAPVPVEDATSAPARAAAPVVDLAVALAAPAAPVVEAPVPTVPAAPAPAAPAPPAPELPGAPATEMLAVDVAMAPTVPEATAVTAPVEAPAVEPTVVAAPQPVQADADVDVDVGVDVTEAREIPDAPVAAARPDRPTAVDLPAPVVAPAPTETVAADVTAAPLPPGPDEPVPLTAPATTPAAATSVAPAPTLVDAPAPVGPADVAAPAPYVQVAEAVGRLRQVEGAHEVTLDLNPAELGPVKVSLTVEGSNVSVHLSAQQGSTDDLLRRHLPDLRASLADAGLTAISVDVGGSAPQRQDLGGDADTQGTGGQAPAGSTESAPDPDPDHPTGTSSTRLDVLL